MKISKKYYSVLFAILFSLVMSFFMSFLLTLMNVGWDPQFFQIWLNAFAAGFLASLPISIIFTPIIRKIVDKMTAD